MTGLTVALMLLAAVVGVLAGVLLDRRRRAASPLPVTTSSEADVIVEATGIEQVLSALPEASVVVDATGRPVRISHHALALTLVHNDRIAIPEIAAMVRDVRQDGVIREHDITVRRPPMRKGLVSLRLRVAPLGADRILVLAEDLSEAQRVDAVRRDFVANVSHELKTPIGALALLSEAVLSSADEPDAVRHFAGRMEAEAGRLSALVGDLIDLSRLQGADPLKDAGAVSVDAIVAEAVDAVRQVAQQAQIVLVVNGLKGLHVIGMEGHLVTALRNLLSNAVNYSSRGTQVTVTTALADGVVEIAVQDQGMGIPESEMYRVFERFYRVDQARSRVTGGTGLGLSIVKHVAENHGGEVAVASTLGEGSTFTLRLPPASTESVPAAIAANEKESA